MKIIITILLIFVCINLVSATYGGENITITLDIKPENCTVNEGINYTIDNYDVTLFFSINFVGDYDITCYSDEEYQSSTGDSSGSSGGSGGSNNDDDEDEYVPTKIIYRPAIPENPRQEEPEVEEPEEEKSNSLWLIIGIIILISIIIYILIKLFRRKNEEEDTYNYNNVRDLPDNSIGSSRRLFKQHSNINRNS